MKLKFLSRLYAAAVGTAMILLPTFINAQAANAQGGLYEFNGHMYQVVDTQMNYYEAVAYCSQEGAHLVTITSSAENSFVSSLPPFESIGWLGATDEAVEGTWQWVTGEPFSYTNWAPGEPTNAGLDGSPENALSFWGPSYPGQWNDVPTWVLRPFVCEYDSSTYDFNGFFQPIDMNGVWNQVQAGSAIPAKFSLNGDQGMSILSTDSPNPTFAFTSCPAGAPTDPLEQTVTAGASSLTYDPTADQYIYVWKTDKRWAGKCGTFTMKLADGTSHSANFSFTK